MAGRPGDRSLASFPGDDPEPPPRRIRWRKLRWPALALLVAGVTAAAVLSWPSSKSSPQAQARFTDGDGLVVFEQQPSGSLGTASPDGGHLKMLAKIGALQGTDIPVASRDGRYLVNDEGQLVTMGPAGPASVSQIPATQSAALSSDGVGWGTAAFAAGTRYVVATECAGDVSGPQQWVADLVPTAGGRDRILGRATSAAGDPQSAAAFVSGPTSSPSAAPQDPCIAAQEAPDQAMVLRAPGQAARTIVTAAGLTGALGWSPGTPVQLSADPDPRGTLLAVSVIADNPAQLRLRQARQAIVMITRTGRIVAHLPLPAADTNEMQWSPDGQQLAICQDTPGKQSSVDIWTAGQAARTVRLPGHHDRDCTQLLWSPDQTQLMYAGQTKKGGLTEAADLQHGWTVIDLRSGRAHDVTAPGQPAAWLPAASGTR